MSRRIFQRRNIAPRHWNSTKSISFSSFFLFFPLISRLFIVLLFVSSLFSLFLPFFPYSFLFIVALRFPLVSFHFFPFPLSFLHTPFSLPYFLSSFFFLISFQFFVLLFDFYSLRFLLVSSPFLSLLILIFSLSPFRSSSYSSFSCPFLPSLPEYSSQYSYRNIFPIFFPTIHNIVTHTVQFETEEMQPTINILIDQHPEVASSSLVSQSASPTSVRSPFLIGIMSHWIMFLDVSLIVAHCLFSLWNLQNNEHGGEGEERRQNDRSPRLAGTPTAPYSSLEKGGAVSPVRSITPEVIQVGRFFSVLHFIVRQLNRTTHTHTHTVHNSISEISPFDISLSVESRRGKEFIYLFIIFFSLNIIAKWKFSSNIS